MKLSNLCELIVDCPHSTANDEGIGYPLIRTPNIGRGRLELENVHRVSKEVYELRNARATPQDNDLIFAREAPAGNVALIKNGEKVCLGQRTVLIRPKEKLANSEYLTYYLLSSEIQYKLLGFANGATVKHVNLPAIRNLDVFLPPLEIQKRIGNILSSYDDLIENNQKQIKLLKEAAQRFYKEWFIDFHFPGHENVKIIDDVPNGWEYKQIQDICCDLYSGGTPSRKNRNYWDAGTINWFKTQELADCWLFESLEKITTDGLKNSSAKIYPKNTILIAIYASPTVGRLGITTEESTCNQAALGLICDESKAPYEWLFLVLYNFRDHFNSLARGAGQQNINVGIVKKQIILYPNKEILVKFKEKISPIFLKIRTLQKEIILLNEARNRLLPKLMSGEIEVCA